MQLNSNVKVSQEQLYDLLLSRELSWQEIIYDLIASEQLDPWDIDLTFLASRYLDKIRQLEEASFFISSKVLLAASILLRIKSELLLRAIQALRSTSQESYKIYGIAVPERGSFELEQTFTCPIGVLVPMPVFP